MMRATILAAFAMALALPAAQAADAVKAAFVYVGPIGDHGWTYQHDQGRLAVEQAFGDKVETLYVENVAEGPDAERAIERFAREGADIVFTTSFGFMNPTVKVAKRFPDVKFEHGTGYKRADNVATYSARFYEGRYVIGRIAARMSKSGVAGYVASFPIPEVVRGINAFLLGAQSINPDFKLKIVWVNTWFDPGKEADATKALIDQGADIITQHTDSPAPIQIAGERGVHGFGQASDMDAFAPTAHYTAIIDDWSAYYIARVQAVMDGTWEVGRRVGRLRRRHGGHGALYGLAGGRRRGRRRDGGEDPLGRVPSLHRPDPRPGRHAPHRRRRAGRRRHAARHELVCEGR